ncbi:P-loop containing nucleoside triphosphate hydrolase protein [Mycena metata]|uniref:P-loop containing nucleoside triphosphate hydrolase protein n=1 Tax=Mycena metata TaxID=1033252 RepID=A0AAD7NM88_9AGAR|nr:P-loop containing nucleoside triphosphate hydrolase protein [Mycena metata]
MAPPHGPAGQSGWFNPRGAKRTVPMKVLVLGYPRTGTASMRDALEIMGYNAVHHMQSIFANPLQNEMWTEAINAKFFGRGRPYGKEEWDQLLGHCQAVTDSPGIMFAEELLAAYPDAKVILTNRNPDRWWKSFTESIGAVVNSTRYRLAALLDPQSLGKFAELSQLIRSVILGPGGTEEEAKRRFTAHYQNVRKIVPKDQILEFEVKEGWGPLCAFLGKDVPAMDFPNTNNKKMFLAQFEGAISAIYRRFALQTLLPSFFLTGILFAIYAGGFWGKQ